VYRRATAAALFRGGEPCGVHHQASEIGWALVPARLVHKVQVHGGAVRGRRRCSAPEGRCYRGPLFLFLPFSISLVSVPFGQVARIRGAWHDEPATSPKDIDPRLGLEISWFWKAKTWCKDDKELYLECEGRAALTFNQFYLLGKALVCSCREEYEECMRDPAVRLGYCNVYWCTHGYSTTARTTFLLRQVCANRDGRRRRRRRNFPQTVIREKTEQPRHLTPARTDHSLPSAFDVLRQEFREASKQLQLSHTPSAVLCREGEHEQIKKFLESAITQGGVGSGACLCILHALRRARRTVHLGHARHRQDGDLPANLARVAGAVRQGTVPQVCRPRDQRHEDALASIRVHRALVHPAPLSVRDEVA